MKQAHLKCVQKAIEAGCEWTLGWSENDTRIIYELRFDKQGWQHYGEHQIGRFSDVFEPGAIAHSTDEAGTVNQWFIPVSDNQPALMHERAMGYGRLWQYLALTVRAEREVDGQVIIEELSENGYDTLDDAAVLVAKLYALQSAVIARLDRHTSCQQPITQCRHPTVAELRRSVASSTAIETGDSTTALEDALNANAHNE